jgi:hypothetical protein
MAGQKRLATNYYSRALNQDETNLEVRRFGRIGVYYNEDGKEELVGSYIRNYSTNFNTFFPFHLNGKDLALYSPDYTATRIMELPSCKDLGGEEPDAMGFCPVDFFVPTYMEQELVHLTNNRSFPARRVTKERVNNPTDVYFAERSEKHSYVNGVTGQECEDTFNYRPLTELKFYPFGFVAGCIWGDDSSWKIQYLDLSEADKGILRRDERFGYISLPQNMTLKDSIDLDNYGIDTEGYSNYIQITSMQTYDLRNGKTIDPLE